MIASCRLQFGARRPVLKASDDAPSSPRELPDDPDLLACWLEQVFAPATDRERQGLGQLLDAYCFA